ncbi:hypothetical protein T11_11543 [Trichinella zimbabwensis]|uniref:Uncharacterized protein n=1 Tax=Trichinella zimbabwensis TaxID=268475 RepID=A0A0V1DP47_9BILA|nr:hypothetical protein T11_11543 [Trichinella zimbabwensis]
MCQLLRGWLPCQPVQRKAFAVDSSNTSVPIFLSHMSSVGISDWPCFWSSRLDWMFDRWLYP